MNQLSDQMAEARALRQPSGVERVEGTVKRVDTVEREITVMLPRGLAVFDVPSHCCILLRGESVKLRLIQPRDPIRITYLDLNGRLIAQMLEVQPDVELRPSAL
jgi:hypothetical protein